jgi:hypothetical protein
MDRLRHRPDYFMYRGNRFYFHRLADGPTLARLDPYTDGEQTWPLNSGRTIKVTAPEIRDITFQVHGIELPEVNPDLKHITDPTLEPRLAALETLVAELAAKMAEQAVSYNSGKIAEPEPVAIKEVPEPEEPVPDPRDEALAAAEAELAALRARVAELEQVEPPFLPAPDALMADYGNVGMDDFTGDLLLDAFEDNEAETAAIVQTLSALRLKHLSEQLNVERARLDREHQATGIANPRSASIDRLLGLLTRRGEV